MKDKIFLEFGVGGLQMLKYFVSFSGYVNQGALNNKKEAKQLKCLASPNPYIKYS